MSRFETTSLTLKASLGPILDFMFLTVKQRQPQGVLAKNISLEPDKPSDLSLRAHRTAGPAPACQGRGNNMCSGLSPGTFTHNGGRPRRSPLWGRPDIEDTLRFEDNRTKEFVLVLLRMRLLFGCGGKY